MKRSAALAALALALLWAVPAAASNDILRLEDATLRIGERGDWHTVELPHGFSPEQRLRANYGTYRLHFSLDALPREPWSVYLAELCMNAVVEVNGAKIGDGGSIREPVARNWNRPLLFRIPMELLQFGDNTVAVSLFASPTSEPRLSRIQVGPDRLLAPRHSRATFRHITVRQVAVVFLFMIALATVVVALLGAAPRSSLWLGATATCIALGQLDGFVRDIPVETLTWQVFNVCAYLAGVVCFVVSMHRLVGHRAPQFERALVGVAVLFATASALSGPQLFVTVSKGTLSSTAVLLFYALWRAYTAGPGSTRVGIAVVSLGVLTLGAIDAGYAFFADGGEGPRASGLIPVLVAGFTGWLLLESLRQVLDRNDSLNAEMDWRVAARESALARTHDRLRLMEQERALTAERGRLIRDMHDGVGTLLVSALALVEGGERSRAVIGDALREILDEMRFMLDSLEPEEEDLIAALGRIRKRFSPRLERAGLHVDWHLPFDATLPPIEAKALHHVMRVVQESIINAYRHANANTISIRTTRTSTGVGPGVSLEIRDDGCGLAAESLDSKRGIANMRKRAEEIGALLEIRSTQPGTIVSLWIPARIDAHG